MTRIAWYRLLSAVCLIGMLNTVVFAEINDSGEKIKWSYRGNLGPARWGQIDSRFMLCAEGRRQSPINIKKKFSPAEYALQIHFDGMPMHIMDNGETTLMLGKVQTIMNTGHSIQLNFTGKKHKEYITFTGNDYELVQFHFHSPSENLLKGVSSPLEIHFVFQGEDGRAAVIGVFVKAGKENATLQKIVDHLPQKQGVDNEISGEKINPADLLPAKKDYYSFMGSLTTPPCTEEIQWLVMADVITASPAQIMRIREAAGGDNARPVQSAHHRVISYSVENKT